MAYTIEQAFAELQSLDVREALRKFQPKIMLVAVGKNGSILKLEKLKTAPSVEDLHRFGDDCKGTSIFIADTDNFKTLDDFRKVVQKNGETIRRRLGESRG